MPIEKGQAVRKYLEKLKNDIHKVPVKNNYLIIPMSWKKINY